MEQTDTRYRFYLNDREIRPHVDLVGDREAPGIGDVVQIEGHAMILGPPGEYRYSTSRRRPGCLLLALPEGSTRFVSATIGWMDADDFDVENSDPRSIVDRREEYEPESYLVNPLLTLTDDETRQLRGLDIHDRVPELDSQLQRLDLARCCVEWSGTSGLSSSLPLRYLRIRNADGESIDQLTSEPLRSALGDLSYLVIHCLQYPLLPFELSTVAECGELRFLSLLLMKLGSGEDLSGLQQLRHLELRSCSGVSDLICRDLGSLRRLRRIRLPNSTIDTLKGMSGLGRLTDLDLSGTSVKSLAPLRAFPTLRSIDATRSRARKLPRGTLPELRDLRVMSTKLSARRVRGFRRRNPGTRVWYEWNAGLQNALMAADSLRVRTGDPKHPDHECDRLLHEERDPRQVRALAERIEIVEGRRGTGCRCNGELSIEFYGEDGLLLSLGLAHGLGASWPEEWPHQRRLTLESGNFIARWLEARGVREFAADRWKQKRQAAAAQRRHRRFAEILSTRLMKAVVRSRTPDRAVERIERAVPDPVARAQVAFTLHGCEERSWNLQDDLDSIVVGLLERISVRDKTQAFRSARADERVIRGVARSLFSDGDPDTVDEATLNRFLSPIATIGLTSPREANRKATVEALGYLDFPAALQLLRRFFRQEIRPRELPPEEETEPAGVVLYSAGSYGSDRARAAAALATLGDRSCLEGISRLASSCGGDDGEAYREALRLFREQEPRTDPAVAISDELIDGGSSMIRRFRERTKELREGARLKRAGERLARR